jgi:hypothetical protein
LKKDLKGKNNLDLLFEIDLILMEWRLLFVVQQLQLTWKPQKQIWSQREQN